MTAINLIIEDKKFPHSDRIIAHLELHIPSGEFVCLIGPSGCGKSTLLNLIAGLDKNYQGSITFGTPQQDCRMGYVFQNPRLLPWRTVRENIELVLPHDTPAHTVDELLASMKLTAVQDTYPQRLSLGMSRRVALVRAFAVNPDILLMDEPFVSLDAPTARKIQKQLITLWDQQQHTVLFVTHDLREAITLADRLIFLSNSPMTIVRDVKITIPRTQRFDDRQIETFRQQLLSEYPDLGPLL
jgi:NitT/TauT family transport system ATP-binding protein